jgi:nucleotide-binding universal stress UspA family protein
VTRLVTAHSPLPVLVVKPEERRPPGPFKVLFAVDGSADGRAAGDFLLSLPFPVNAEVTALHVVASSFSDLPERFALEINDRIKEAVAGSRARELAASGKILEEAKRSLESKFRTVSLLSRVGDPSAEIVKAAASGKADMVVVGCRGPRRKNGMMGSVSKNVLTHAPCPVLIGKSCD